jgi:hypothetical protein
MDLPRVRDDHEKKGRIVTVRRACIRPFCGTVHGSVCNHLFGVQFGVHAVPREPCMRVIAERGSLLRPLLAGPAGQALATRA